MKPKASSLLFVGLALASSSASVAQSSKAAQEQRFDEIMILGDLHKRREKP